MEKAFILFAGAVLGYLIEKGFSENKTLKKLLKITIMSQENLDLLLGRVSQLKTSLTNIQGDITRIKDGLPQSGGLSEAEVETLRAELDTTASQADTLDKENEEATGPTEGL